MCQEKKSFLCSFIFCECVAGILQVTGNTIVISSTLLSYFVLKLYNELLISPIQKITKLGITEAISCKVTITTMLL